MVEAGLKPVYVFDGKPPKMKSHELAKRKERGRIFLLFVSIESLNSSNKKQIFTHEKRKLAIKQKKTWKKQKRSERQLKLTNRKDA